MIRGIERRKIFNDDKDRENFIGASQRVTSQIINIDKCRLHRAFEEQMNKTKHINRWTMRIRKKILDN